MNKKIFVIFVGIILLIGALSPKSNVTAGEDFEKIYKLPNICSFTDSDIRFIFPGNLRVAGCFHFSKFSGGLLW
jgi:hypothetical protein